MSAQLVYDLVVAWLPSIIAILTFVGVVFKLIKEFVALKKTVVDMKSIEDVNDKMKQVLNENYELKKDINELLTKIDHVDRRKK